MWYLQIDVIGQIFICYQSLLYYALCIGNWYTDLVKSNGIENLKCLTHANEVRRVVEIQEGLAEFRSLRNRNVYNKLEKIDVNHERLTISSATRVPIHDLRRRCNRRPQQRVLGEYFVYSHQPLVNDVRNGPRHRKE